MPKIKFRSKKGRSLGKGREKLMSERGKSVQKKPAEDVKRLSQDLQVHQIKPEGQNAGVMSEITRKEQAEETLRNSEKRLRQFSQLIMAHEVERKSLSQELENSTLSKLNSIKGALEKKISQLGKEFAPERLELENLISTAHHATEDTRRIMMNLYPCILDDVGFLAGLNFFLGEFSKIHPHVQLNKQIGLQEIDVPKHLRVVIFRVFQEALNNFVKYGQGDQIYVALKKKGGAIKLLIEDNGTGFLPKSPQSGSGLDAMRGRVELSGGIFKTESATGKGTTIRASWL